MERRWWALPVALSALMVGACGAAGSSAGGDGPTPTDVAVSSGSRPALPSGECRGWAISLPSTDVHGADTPQDAANSTRFGIPPQLAFDATTWTTVASSVRGVALSQDGGSVEVSQVSDGSWFVMSGRRCS